jgi:hypothetical protein
MAAIAPTPVDKLDMLVRWAVADPLQARFWSGIDTATRTIRVMGGGVWHAADADRYFEQQAPIVAEARRRYGAVRAFYDVREWVVQRPQCALQFQERNAALYRPEDRIAALVGSSLCKQHPRTALGTENREVFISPTAAERWLQAYAEAEV